MSNTTYNRSLFPKTRMRRNRKSASLRGLVQENNLSTSSLIQPLFVMEGNKKSEPVDTMPGIKRLSPDLILEEARILSSLGIPALAIFPAIEKSKKSLLCEEAHNPKGLIQQTIKLVKKYVPDLMLITDVALDPYTVHGHDGVLDQNGFIDNDETNKILTKQALSHAEAGADIVGPSDMMDGRILNLREAFEKNQFKNTGIMAYSAKFASNYYGPFRSAIGTSQNSADIDKSSYQMDFHNSDEALHECALDLKEGADILLIKPGMPYLDIISKVKETFRVPTFAYQVSGEYSMHCLAIEQKIFEKDAVIMESLTAFKRAGADAILTYFAKEAAQIMQKPGNSQYR